MTLNIPKIRRPRAGGKPKYPYAKLAVGEACTIKVETDKEAQRIALSALQYAYRHGWKLITRRVDNGLWIGREK